MFYMPKFKITSKTYNPKTVRSYKLQEIVLMFNKNNLKKIKSNQKIHKKVQKHNWNITIKHCYNLNKITYNNQKIINILVNMKKYNNNKDMKKLLEDKNKKLNNLRNKLKSFLIDNFHQKKTIKTKFKTYLIKSKLPKMKCMKKIQKLKK